MEERSLPVKPLFLFKKFNHGAGSRSNYTPNVDFAFNSIEHIMRDVNNGWLIRYTHGAPCDGIFEQTDFVEKIICLLSIIP